MFLVVHEMQIWPAEALCHSHTLTPGLPSGQLPFRSVSQPSACLETLPADPRTACGQSFAARQKPCWSVCGHLTKNKNKNKQTNKHDKSDLTFIDFLWFRMSKKAEMTEQGTSASAAPLRAWCFSHWKMWWSSLVWRLNASSLFR